MDVMFRDEQPTVRFGETFVASESFKLLFREGMTLVEETAAYLDGPAGTNRACSPATPP